MARAPNPKLLLVEGKDDLFVVSELFERSTQVVWEPSPRQYLIEVDWCGSSTEILGQMQVRWKESGRRVMGIVIDADTSGSRWAQVRAHAPPDVAALLPDVLPENGLVVDVGHGRRFGAWIMPDNLSSGMLETFLMRLRSTTSAELKAHVVSAMQTARRMMEENASDSFRPRPWKEAHADKAELHTWLAWQDPPGLQLHEAVMRNLLDLESPLAKTFVQWMRRLYEL